MSRSNPPPPSADARDNNAPKPPSLSIQEALAKINRERLANLTSSGPPGTSPQPGPSTSAPHRFVNPRDVEQVDTTEFWRAGEENRDEKDGEFLEECRRERQRWKEEANRAANEKMEKENGKPTENVQKEGENASLQKDVGGSEEVEQVDGEGGPQPEPASPKPPEKEVNEWKYWKEFKAGLPPRRPSAAKRDTDSNAG